MYRRGGGLYFFRDGFQSCSHARKLHEPQADQAAAEVAKVCFESYVRSLKTSKVFLGGQVQDL